MVGLGNPGKKYLATRHNVGFMVLQKLAAKEGVNFRTHNKLHGDLAEIKFGLDSIKLLMPNTFMNDSGLAIRSTMDWYGLNIDQLLVLVDDIDLPLGKMRFREQGSSGGHNGLKSTISHLGSQNFCRLKIGIGAPSLIQNERKEKTVSHVLGRFNTKENKIVNQILDEIIISLDLFQKLGIEKATTHINSYKSEKL